MLEEQKELYRSQLQRDSAKEFDNEFFRTTNLEREIINLYGFEGIKLIFEKSNSSNYFLLGEFPADCPWSSLNDESITSFIGSNFELIEDKIPNLLESLKERCKFIYAERKENTWQLHYFLDMHLYDEREYFRIYTGGAPNPNPVVNESLKSFNWTIPLALAEFYSIHDGFGELNDANFVLNSQSISVMATMMNPICEENKFEHPEEYKFEDLLEFFPDGAGNVQCFYRKNEDSFNALTVDWDHEIWEISEEMDFFEFIDERMSEIDEE